MNNNEINFHSPQINIFESDFCCITSKFTFHLFKITFLVSQSKHVNIDLKKNLRNFINSFLKQQKYILTEVYKIIPEVHRM